MGHVKGTYRKGIVNCGRQILLDFFGFQVRGITHNLGWKERGQSIRVQL
jgi:hypothetical protein